MSPWPALALAALIAVAGCGDRTAAVPAPAADVAGPADRSLAASAAR